MRKGPFTTAVALGVAIASYAMMPPSARATTPNTCAILAGSFAPNSPTRISPTDQLHQMIQRKIYAACLQARGKQGASRMTTPRAGTSTTSAGTFVTFDVPGATSTNPASINKAGAISGSYFDAGGLPHGFLRTSDGTITPFDAPGAAGGTAALGINPAGTIVGEVASDPAYITGPGFLRTPNGTITEFGPPFAKVTQAYVINPDGVAAGAFLSYKGGVHGFLRAPNGTITTFDPLSSVFTV